MLVVSQEATLRLDHLRVVIKIDRLVGSLVHRVNRLYLEVLVFWTCIETLKAMLLLKTSRSQHQLISLLCLPNHSTQISLFFITYLIKYKQLVLIYIVYTVLSLRNSIASTSHFIRFVCLIALITVTCVVCWHTRSRWINSL